MPMISMLNRQQAADAVDAAAAERDTIQQNLLDLDGSFGKQLLSGAQLAGTSKQRWDEAAATLAGLWDVFGAYNLVIERARAIMAGRLNQKELMEVSTLLAGPSVDVQRAPVPGGRKDLTDSGRDQLTLATARARMRGQFKTVTDVTTAAEQNWTDVAGKLDAATRNLAGADGAADEDLGRELASIRTELDRLRAALNADPLAQSAGPAAAELVTRSAAVAAKAADLARIRDGAVQRIAAARAAADAARAARADAQAARARVAEKIVVAAIPPLPDDPGAGLAARLAAVDGLLSAGRWTRLSTELDQLERELTAATEQFRAAERSIMAVLGQRDELRGLLDAYKAKAGRLGAAEDPALAARYDQARGLLWTAPCDLAAAQRAVDGYQQAVLAIGAR
jgi:hypothetical protein